MAFLVVDASRHFLGGGCFATFLEGSLERPLRSFCIKTITDAMVLLEQP